MREKDYYGAIKGFCIKWGLPEVWNSDRITGANLIYEVIKVINSMIVELREYEDRVDGKLAEMKLMIEEFLLMFDEDLSDTVVTILNDWLDSGKLAGIISDEVLGMKADKVDFEEIKDKVNDKFTSVKEYGAKGDGVTDDTLAIQNAIDYGFENNEFEIYVPSGDYIISKPLILKTKRDTAHTSWWEGRAIQLTGQDKSSTRIIKKGEATHIDFSEEVNGIDSTVILFAGSSVGGGGAIPTEGGGGTGIEIKNIFLINESTNTEALALTGLASHRMTIQNINVKSNKGIQFDDAYANVFRNIVLFCKEESLYIESGTSNLLENIYCSVTKNPYKVNSAYSNLIQVYADGATGSVFKLGGMGLTMLGCGTESPKATNIIEMVGVSDYNSIDIVSLTIHRQTGDDISVENQSVIKGNGSFNLKHLTVLEQKKLSEGQNSYIYKSKENNINDAQIGTVKYVKNFIGVDNPKMFLTDVSTGAKTELSINSVKGNVSLRRGTMMPFIGTRHLGEIYSTNITDKAIYLDNESKFTSSGLSTKDQNAYNVGDVLLLNDPKDQNILGYSITDKTDAFVSGNTFTPIPLSLIGKTSERPTTNLFDGLMFYDTTLEKPIWYMRRHAAWLDAMGEQV